MRSSASRWGVLLLFSGVGKVLEGPGEFVAGFVERFEETWLPGSLVAIVGHLLPWTEIGIGALLVLGLVTVPAMIAVGVLFLEGGRPRTRGPVEAALK